MTLCFARSFTYSTTAICFLKHGLCCLGLVLVVTFNRCGQGMYERWLLKSFGLQFHLLAQS